MITLQDQLEPSAEIGWLHAEKIISKDQIVPSSGTRSVIPTAVYSLAEYVWESSQW